jgi:hypothetical protein
MRLPREVRRTIRAFLVLAVPLAIVTILAMGLFNFVPKWDFGHFETLDENICCCGTYRY